MTDLDYKFWEESFPAADWTGGLKDLQASWSPRNIDDAVSCAVLWGATEDDLALRTTVWEPSGFDVHPSDPIAAARGALHELVDRGHVDLWLPSYSYDRATYIAADRHSAHELIDDPLWWIPYDEISDEFLREPESNVDENGKQLVVAGQVEEVRVTATDLGIAWVRKYGSFGHPIMRIPRPEYTLDQGRLPWQRFAPTKS